MKNTNAAAEQHDDLLAQAEEMLKELQKGNDATVSSLLQKLSDYRDASLYQEVGKMTRQLHDSLNSFRKDTRIDALAEEEIPNARERLTYVIDMTQKAADRTLGAVEKTMPLADKISQGAGELKTTWQKFRRRELSVDEFRDLSNEIENFLGIIEKDSEVMKNNLNDVLMAQDFQDLTGQIIKRVITLVEEVEGNLVELIRITGERMSLKREEEKDTSAEGPFVPGVDKGEHVNNQDDVDDLLSSLGF